MVQSLILRHFYAAESACTADRHHKPTSEELTDQLRRLYSIHPFTTHQTQTQEPGTWNLGSGKYPQCNKSPN